MSKAAQRAAREHSTQWRFKKAAAVEKSDQLFRRKTLEVNRAESTNYITRDHLLSMIVDFLRKVRKVCERRIYVSRSFIVLLLHLYILAVSGSFLCSI